MQACKYFEYCGKTMRSMVHIVKKGVCVDCDRLMHKLQISEINIRDTDQKCSVCYENKGREMEFPVLCGHWFCVECTKLLIERDDSMQRLNPIYYGCDPCPRGCINPAKGKQCCCPEKLDVMEVWMREDPRGYLDWCKDEKFWRKHGMRIDAYDGFAFGTRKCPICRKGCT
jgi:hypothetical protein